MKYFVIEGTFKDELNVGKEELEKTIAAHIAFLEKGFEEGWILVSGPKAASGGGIIVAKAPSYETIAKFLDEDPLKISGMQDYHVVEFKLHKCQELVKGWFI